jgi:RNA-directed DNA polymerase
MIDDEAEAREAGAKGQEAGQYPVGRPCGAESITAAAGQTKAEVSRLMEAVIERSNVWSAYQKVVRNGGAPGVDGLTVGSFRDWLKRHWPCVRAALLDGSYLPSEVRAVDIPKPSGGVRTLGIPTVLDRLIQQALLQVLQPIVEPTFSASSYGLFAPSLGLTPSGPAFGCSKSFQTILSGRGAVPIKLCVRPSTMCRRAVRGWWIWTWRSSSTG